MRKQQCRNTVIAILRGRGPVIPAGVSARSQYNLCILTDSELRVPDDPERGQMRQWLERWQRVGPLLERERIARFQALTEADAGRIACDLWSLARPGGGDDGEGLLIVKRVLGEAERR